MCEHCGCLDLDPIHRFMAEHELIRDLGDDVRRLAGTHPDEARVVLARLLAVLEPHARAEEEGLLRLLAADEEFAAYVHRLEAEHWDLHEALDRAAISAEWARLVPPILDRLDDHTLREDYDLFPAAVVSLCGQEWAQITAARRAAGLDPVTPAQVPAG